MFVLAALYCGYPVERTCALRGLNARTAWKAYPLRKGHIHSRTPPHEGERGGITRDTRRAQPPFLALEVYDILHTIFLLLLI